MIVSKQQLQEGIPAFILFSDAFSISRSAARRLIQQGGGYINKIRIEQFDRLVTERDIGTLVPGKIILSSGKKKFSFISIGG